MTPRISARHPEPALITSAEPSLSEQIDARRRRYALTMGLRTLCLVLASVVSVTLTGWLRWVLLAVTLLGAVALPWIAVLVANDRPPKSRAERRAAWHPEPNPQPALPRATKIIDG